MITKIQAISLTHHQSLFHATMRTASGKPVVCRVNGKCKTWKTRPGDWSLPVKTGLNDCFHIGPDNADEWCLEDPRPAPNPDAGLKAALETAMGTMPGRSTPADGPLMCGRDYGGEQSLTAECVEAGTDFTNHTKDQAMKFNKGQKVQWRATGKVSRLDGVAGQIVTGVVVTDDGTADIIVRKDYKSLVELASVPRMRLFPDQTTTPAEWLSSSGTTYTTEQVVELLQASAGSSITTAILEQTYKVGRCYQNGGVWFQRVK